MTERQERQSQRGALVQISLTAKEKRKKETAGALERAAGEREEEKERERGKKLKSCFINAVSINLSSKTIAGIYN